VKPAIINIEMKTLYDILNESEEQLDDIFQKYFTVYGTYTFENSLVHVYGDCIGKISLRAIGKIPVKFGTVTGVFDVKSKGLTSLDGGPSYTKSYICSSNKLSNLVGLPKTLNGLVVQKHQLTSLEGFGTVITGIHMMYSPDLPLLRVFCNEAKTMCSIIWYDTEQVFQTVYMTLINEWYGKGLRGTDDSTVIKQCLWEAQDRLIQAGLDANAKW
jgi:hypothetical protein